MRLVILINDYKTLVPTMATAMLMASAVRRGHEVFVFGVADWTVMEDGSLWALARSFPAGEDLPEQLQQLKAQTPQQLPLESCDVLWLRTNPARDERRWAHDSSLLFAELLESRGVLVWNSPTGLRKASSKLYLMSLPEEVRPKTFVAHHPVVLRSFLEKQNEDCVVKPVQGTRGRDVFVLRHPRADNQNQILDVLQREGFTMAQTFVPEAPAGDTRLIVLKGKLLEQEGKVAAVHRVPGKDDFRSNIHTGGTPKPPVVTDAMREVVEKIRPHLQQDGLHLVGVDFIGGKIIELNVFSTGGFQDAEKFTGVSFTESVIEAIEEDLASKTA